MMAACKYILRTIKLDVQNVLVRKPKPLNIKLGMINYAGTPPHMTTLVV